MAKEDTKKVTHWRASIYRITGEPTNLPRETGYQVLQKQYGLVFNLLNRVSKKQVHIVDNFTGVKAGAGQYYIQHTSQEWLDNYDWAKGTVIVPQEDLNTNLIK